MNILRFEQNGQRIITDLRKLGKEGTFICTSEDLEKPRPIPAAPSYNNPCPSPHYSFDEKGEKVYHPQVTHKKSEEEWCQRSTLLLSIATVALFLLNAIALLISSNHFIVPTNIFLLSTILVVVIYKDYNETRNKNDSIKPLLFKYACIIASLAIAILNITSVINLSSFPGSLSGVQMAIIFVGGIAYGASGKLCN